MEVGFKLGMFVLAVLQSIKAIVGYVDWVIVAWRMIYDGKMQRYLIS